MCDISYLCGKTFANYIMGQEIKYERVLEARHEEVEHFEKMGVLEKTSHNQARVRTARSPIAVKWVDAVKAVGKYRLALVAK